MVPLGQDSRFNLSGNWPIPTFSAFLPGEPHPCGSRVRGQLADQLVRHRHEDASTRMMKGGAKLPTLASAWVQPVDHYPAERRAPSTPALFIGLTFLQFLHV